jgi:hypothetical protein
MGAEAAVWVAGEILVDNAIVAPAVASWVAGEALVDAGVSAATSAGAGAALDAGMGAYELGGVSSSLGGYAAPIADQVLTPELASQTVSRSMASGAPVNAMNTLPAGAQYDATFGQYLTPDQSIAMRGMVNPATGISLGAEGMAASGASAGNIFSQYADQYMKAFNANPIKTGLQTLNTGSSILNSLSGAMNTPTTPPMKPGAAGAQADPWAQYRPQYAARLNELQANPSLTMSEPGYQFFRQQGEQGVQRGAAKAGMSNSGNLGIALSNYNQDYALKAFNNLSDRYSGLAQANAKATTGVDAFQSAQKTAYDQNNDYLKALNQGVGSISSIFNPITSGTPAPQASTPSGYNPSGSVTNNAISGYNINPNSISGDQIYQGFNPDFSIY